MRYFYDLEFLEDGRTVDLISIGIVAEDGREFYAVAEEAGKGTLHRRITAHRWLMENVVPQLPLARSADGTRLNGGLGLLAATPRFELDKGHLVVLPRRVIAKQVQAFLCAERGDVELWAYYGAYDHVCLMQLWGPMIAKPDRLPMWTHDINQLAERVGVDGERIVLPEQPAGHHNALDDARHVKAMWDYLTSVVA